MIGSPRFRSTRRLATVAGVVVAATIVPAAAHARTITIGPSLINPYAVGVTFLSPSVTVANSALAEPEAQAVSPVDGVILRWRLTAQGAADPYALRVLHPTGSGAYTGGAASVTKLASTTSIQTFATELPIKAGDAIGIDMPKTNPTLKAAAVPGGADPYWSPLLDVGTTAPPTGVASGLEFGFNADVQPAPRVVLVSPSSGPIAGGTAVTIAGSDFTGVKEVKFGSVPASSFKVESESEITAVAPAAGAGSVDVSVTTIAGASPSKAGDRFTYEAPAVPAPPTPAPLVQCIVPKLTGKSLKAGRKALGAAHCKVGKVTRGKGKAAKIVKQSPKAGTAKPDGSAVNVTLG